MSPVGFSTPIEDLCPCVHVINCYWGQAAEDTCATQGRWVPGVLVVVAAAVVAAAVVAAAVVAAAVVAAAGECARAPVRSRTS